jgi:hypothetical protein
MKKKHVIGIVMVVCIAVGIMFVLSYLNLQQTQIRNKTNLIPAMIINESFPAENISLGFQGSENYFSINAEVPETTHFIPLYKGTLSDDDLKSYLKYISPDAGEIKKRTPSISEAPVLAEKALLPYGGLPSDAVLFEVSYSTEGIQNSSGESMIYPIATQVGYRRQINGMPVVGQRDSISVDLGTNGQLLELRKRWRTLEKTDQVVQIIPPDKAVEKLKNGETYTRLQSPSNVLIDDVRLGYYERPGNIREVVLEPVWIFRSTSNPIFEFPVYARQFANFIQTPSVITKAISGKSVQVKDPFTTTFTDTSDANPTKWQWDFGDGTTSAEQNPTHQYKAAGTYKVTLTVWNDLGSDTMSQQYIVDAAPVKMAEDNITVKSTDTLSDLNETIATTSPSLSATVITGNISDNTTTTIQPAIAISNTTVTAPVPTASLNVTPSSTVNSTSG